MSTKADEWRTRDLVIGIVILMLASVGILTLVGVIARAVYLIASAPF